MKSSQGFALLGGLLLIAAVGIGAAAYLLWHTSSNRSASFTAPHASTSSLKDTPIFTAQDDHSLYRDYIYYYTNDNKLYAVSSDLKRQIDLSSYGVPIERDYGCQVLSSLNGDVLYFEKDSSIWTINADGTGLQQLNPDLSVDCAHTNGLVATNSDGSLLILYNQGTPALPAGVYLYTATTHQLTRLAKLNGDSIPNIQFVGNKAQYLDGSKGILYRIDLTTGASSVISARRFEATDLSTDTSALYYLPGQPVVAIETGDTGNPTGTNFSQIVLVNYATNKKVAVSPLGTWAEYQYLSPSPNFKHILYGHQIYDRTTKSFLQVIRIDYYEFNATTGVSSPWPIKAYPDIWINDDSFVYFDAQVHELYKYDLITKEQQSIAFGIQYLVY